MICIPFRCKAHHLFYPGPVVPASVEEDKLTRNRQFGSVTLEIPFPILPVRRLTQGDYPGFAGAKMFNNPFYGSVFPGCIPTFQYYQKFKVADMISFCNLTNSMKSLC